MMILRLDKSLQNQVLNTTEDEELINQIGSLAIVPRVGRYATRNSWDMPHRTRSITKSKTPEDPNSVH